MPWARASCGSRWTTGCWAMGRRSRKHCRPPSGERRRWPPAPGHAAKERARTKCCTTFDRVALGKFPSQVIELHLTPEMTDVVLVPAKLRRDRGVRAIPGASGATVSESTSMDKHLLTFDGMAKRVFGPTARIDGSLGSAMGPGVGGFDLSESDAFGQIGTMLREFVAPCHCAPV